MINLNWISLILSCMYGLGILNMAQSNLKFIVNGDRVVGQLLFGSLAKGTFSMGSDIDVAIIVENGRVDCKRMVIDGFKLDLHKYPLKIFVKLLTGKLSWHQISLPLEILKNSIIIEDKRKILEKLIKSVQDLRIVKKYVGDLTLTARRNILYMEKLIDKGLEYEAKIALQSTINSILMLEYVRRGIAPNMRPRDLYGNLLKLEDEELRFIYEKCIGLRSLRRRKVEEAFNEIFKLGIHRIFKVDFEDMLNAYAKGAFKEAFLTAKYIMFKDLCLKKLGNLDVTFNALTDSMKYLRLLKVEDELRRWIGGMEDVKIEEMRKMLRRLRKKVKNNSM